MTQELHVYNPNSAMHRRKVRNERIRKLIVILCIVVVLAPFYIAILYAFKPATEITANRLMFTQNPTLENFRRVIFENPLFRIGFTNSVINTISSSIRRSGTRTWRSSARCPPAGSFGSTASRRRAIW